MGIPHKHAAIIKASENAEQKGSEIRWCADGQIFGRPTATDALEYAEQRLRDPEEMICCKSDMRLNALPNIRELLSVAKATVTAGELPKLPDYALGIGGLHADSRREYYTAAQMREYGQQCAEAARSLVISQVDYNRDMDELAQDFEPVANMDLLKAKLHIVGLRKRLKNVKAKAEAARQPAPVVSDEQILTIAKKELGHWNYEDDVVAFAQAILAATRSQP